MPTAPTFTAGKLTAADSFPQSSWVRLRTFQYTDCCFVESERTYHTIPASGEGSEGTNYHETTYGYDSLKRRIRTESPGGTIVRVVLDPRGLTLESWTGTNDTGATPSDPSGGGAGGNNMKQTDGFVFDYGLSGGDSLLTSQDAHVDASTVRVTLFTNDFRGRQTIIDGEVDFFQQTCFDNFDRPIQVDRRNTSAGGNLVARSQTKYDDRGRVFRTLRYGVDPATGSVGNALTDNTWYDQSGNVVKSQPAGSKLFTKSVVDGAGRTTKQYLGFDLSETSYTNIFTVTGDTILRQTETLYDAASDVIQETLRLRYHSATGTGELGTPSSTQPKARVMYTAIYPDPIGRNQATADYGTNGGTALTRSDTIPARADDILVSSVTFDTAGDTNSTTDPAEKTDCFTRDARGRETLRWMNCRTVVSSSSSSSSSSSGGPCDASDDTNVDVLTAYNADGNTSAITAVNPRTGDQTTQYEYGTDLTNSEIASSMLLFKEILPDSVDADDVKSYKYNRQSERTEFTDQNGTVHAYVYDLLGRMTHDRVTTAGTGIDTTVLRISQAYEVRGMLEKLTSWDHATVGSGSIVNEVLFQYNAFGQLTHDYQSHAGAVNTTTTPVVQYAFAGGSDNHIRPLTLIYPDGRELHYGYGTVNGINDAASRVASLIDDDGTTHLADYAYLGDGIFVEVDYTEPQVKWTMIRLEGGNDPDTGDIYGGFDRFTRIKDNRWFNYNTNADVDRLLYGYDRASNRLWRENPVAAALGKHFDELYTYDGLHRLKSTQRGDLNAQKTAITNGTFAECWTLDAMGNWPGYRRDSDGTTSWDLVQSRTANKVNEITAITNSIGSGWAQPAYDRAGNMTTIPKPDDPTSAYAGVYDAWNRLVRVSEDANSVSEHAYDGAKRRIVQTSYSGGVLSETLHLFYTEPSQWQAIEERVGTASTSDRQFAFGLRYVDDLLLRDRASERVYALQDANWNITSIVHNSATVAERFAYGSYGTPLFLTDGFVIQASSTQGWHHLFTGSLYYETLSLYYTRHRWYGAEVGAWISRDWTTTLLETHLYLYVSARPTYYVDPSGLQQEREFPFEEWERIQRGRMGGHMRADDIQHIINQGTRGCIGYGAGELGYPLRPGSSLFGKGPSSPNFPLNHCFKHNDTNPAKALSDARALQKGMTCPGTNCYGNPAMPRIVNIQFHDTWFPPPLPPGVHGPRTPPTYFWPRPKPGGNGEYDLEDTMGHVYGPGGIVYWPSPTIVDIIHHGGTGGGNFDVSIEMPSGQWQHSSGLLAGGGCKLSSTSQLIGQFRGTGRRPPRGMGYWFNSMYWCVVCERAWP